VALVKYFMTPLTPEGTDIIRSIFRLSRENRSRSFRREAKGVLGLAVATGRIPGNLLKRLWSSIDNMPSALNKFRKRA